MSEVNNHIIYLVDGCLAPKSTTSRDDVHRIVARALESSAPSGIVMHFHGGLVSKSAARKSVEEKLYPLYAERARAYPIFFIWESGFFEAPLNNLKEIAKEDLFQEFVKKAAEWVLKKLPSDIGFKGGSGTSINEAELRADFDDWFEGRRKMPPEQLETRSDITDISIATKSKGIRLDEQTLEANIIDSIEGDNDFKDAVQGIYNGLYADYYPRPTTRGNGTRVTATSLVSKEASDRMFDPATGTTKGFDPISWVKIAKIVVSIVIRVLRRFRIGRAHGMYITLVEETLRELYVDKIGRHVWWNRMKVDTADAFKEGQDYGGTALLTELRSQLKGVDAPKITLVGHSTGAIYICNLLIAAAQHLPEPQFDVIFQAPAATYALLASTVAEHGSRIRNFRQFGMNDEREATDILIPVLYLRSLLYFVSGLLESDPDEPLVGMARYLDKSEVYDADSFPNINTCRHFYNRYCNSLIWSPSDQGGGLNSDGKSHSEFDDMDEATMDSVQYILQQGF